MAVAGIKPRKLKVKPGKLLSVGGLYVSLKSSILHFFKVEVFTVNGTCKNAKSTIGLQVVHNILLVNIQLWTLDFEDAIERLFI